MPNNNNSNNETWLGPYVPWKQIPSGTPTNIESGSAFRIGDGFWLTAGHISFEFNQETAIGARDILESNRQRLDFFDYKGAYRTLAQSFNTALVWTDPMGHNHNAENDLIESLGGRALSGKDTVVITGSGSVDKDDAGLAVFYDAADLHSVGASLGSNLERYYHYISPSGATVKGHVGGSINGPSGFSNGFSFSVGANRGESGGGYLFDFDSKQFILGNQSTTTKPAGPSGTAYGVYIDPTYFVAINNLIGAGQNNNVTDTEPTNLIVGSGSANADMRGSYRADIMLGRNGNDVLDGTPLAATNAWGNDQLYGGADDDTLKSGFGNDLLHGGDFRAYGGTRPAIEGDGVDTADYTALTTTDPDKGIVIKLLDQTTIPAGTTDPDVSLTFKNTFGTETDFEHAIFVADTARKNGVDTLISVEKVIGTSAVDKLLIRDLNAAILAGPDKHGGLYSVDLAGGSNATTIGDTIDLSKLSEAARVDLRTTAVSALDPTKPGGYVAAFNDANRAIFVKNAEIVIGSNHDDSLTGDEQANELFGGKGADTLAGGGGSDFIDGGDNVDKLDGGYTQDATATRGVTLDFGIHLSTGGTDKAGARLTEIVKADTAPGASPPTTITAVNVENLTLTKYSDVINLKSLGSYVAAGAPLGADNLLTGLKIDFGSAPHPALGDDKIDATNLNISSTALGPLVPAGSVGVRIDLSNHGDQTVQYRVTDAGKNVVGTSAVLAHFANANSAVGTANDDEIIGAGGKIEISLARGSSTEGPSEGYSTLYGLEGNDTLISAGWESHLNGGTGNDRFHIGSGTHIDDGEAGDRTSYGGIDLFGGVKQWWMEGNKAYAAQISTLLTVFPVIGSELLYTASFFIDVNWMKFASYKLAEDGTLLMNLGWGQAGTGAVHDYNVNLDSGIASAGLAVFEAVRGGSGTAGAGGVAGNLLNTFINLALYAAFGHGMPGSDPLVLDLNGDGFNLTTEANSKAYFEFDSDGFAEHTGWVRATDGFLVRDANANGKIDNVTEMFGNATANGFDVLAGYDDNLDGAITAADSVFASLQVWQDANQDGVTDAGELKSLADLGIVSISLTHAAPADPTAVGGNAITHIGSFTRADGSSGGVANVVLATNDAKTQWLGDRTVDAVAATLPQLAGSGEMRDLRVAMTADATLEASVSAFAANTSNDLVQLKDDAEAILYRWAGVDGVAATAIGVDGFDARKLAFLEKFTGVQLMARDAGGMLDLTNLDQVTALWSDQLTRQTLRLVVQGPLADTFEGLTYRADIDLLVANGPNSFADVLHRVIADLPAGAADAAAMWAEWAPLLGVVSEGMVRADANVVRSDFLFTQLLRAADSVTQPLSIAALATGLGIADLRLGTAGADTLARGAAGDTAIYYGGGGDDVLNGGSGQDVYVFGHSIGHATINDIEANPAGDRIRFAFLNQDEVTLARDGNDLLITVAATSETVRVIGQFAPVVPLGSDVLLSSDKGVEDIQFADGSVMEIPEIMVAVGKGSDGDDHMIGTMHSDAFTGGLGDDLLEGGDDADLYVFNRGDGDDVIHDQQTTPLLRAADMLVLGDDIAPEDLVFARAGTTGDDLLITIGDGGGSILVSGQFAYTSLGFHAALAPNSRIEVFAFRQYGETYSNHDLQQMLIAQDTTDGADTTRGFGDDDSFAASAGNDVLIGMDGADTYDWGVGAGNDTIREQAQYIDINVGLGGISLTVRADVVQFDSSIDPAHLIFARDYDTDDLTITNTTTGETLTVDGQFNSFQTGVLGAQWFDRVEWFAFADNSAYSWQDVEAMVTTGSSGDDRLRGDIMADQMVGGTGDDLLSGGGGGDTYVFDAGDGHDTIFDDNRTLIGDGFLTADQTIDTVLLGAGIDPDDVIFSRDGSSITLTFGGSGDAITLQGQDDYIQTGVFGALPTCRVERIVFDDGTIWTWQDINQKMIAAQTTAGNDVTQGFTLADRFEKSAGDDVLRGGESGDTYVFGVGAGHDRIEESVDNVLYGDDDSVEFDATVAVADVSVARDGNDLVLTLTSGDSLRIAGEFDLQTLYTWTDVENFRFADGTVWSKTLVQQKLLEATSGDDHLIGFYSGDDLDGGAGNDILEGGDGGDTYHFGRGYGNDEIRESVTEVNVGDFDQIVFGPALLPEDLNVARDGNDLIFTVIDTGETLRVANQFNFNAWFSWNDVELFTFANGTQWTDLQIAARLTGGTSGDDHLIGTFRSDTLDGKEGDDLLEGGDGSDLYVFGRGYGHDEIRESLTDANLGEDDEVRFGANITLADLGFTRDGDTLIISILGTSDTLTLTGEFTYSTPYTWNDVERFTFANGSFITKADIGNIVLTGTSSDEHIVGFGSGDTIDGKGGDDILEGRDGSDTYRFGVGDGHDQIWENLDDGRSSEDDTLSFKAGVLPADVTVTRDGQDAVFTLASGDSIRVVGQFNEGYNEFLSFNDVERATFADGTVWDKIEIDRRSIHTTAGDDLMLGSRYEQTYDGGAGNDTIYAGNNNDTLIGGTGNDHLEGDGGDDIYIYNLGDGHDVIHDYSYGNDGADRIVFGPGIAPGDLRFANNPADSTEIVISFANATGSITVQNQWWGDAGVEFLEFDDGTVWDQSQIAAAWIAGQATPGDDTVFGSGASDTLNGAAGNDHVLAGGGDDQITGGTGDDRLEGDSGNDTYVYNLGDGNDTIYDYNWNNDQADRIVFGAGITPATVQLHNNGNGGDLRVTFAGDAGSILIQSQWQGDAGIESFEFADGTIWDQTQIAAHFVADQSTSGNDEIFSPFGGAVNGGAGNDLIHSGDADDVITGGTGDDRLESGYGNDVYVYNLGDGNDVIYDYSWNNDQADRIVFGAGISPATIHLENNGNGGDLRVTFDGSAGSILVQSQWQGDAGVEFFEFADGTIWDQSQIAVRFLADQATSGNDIIFGTPFGGALDAGAGDDLVHTGDNDDIVTGGTGNDRLESGYGNDRYIYNLGDGNDVIHDYSWNNDQADRIVFGAGIAPDDVLIDTFGSDGTIRLSFKHADGSITVEQQGWGDTGVEFVDFDDGTIWDLSQINAHIGSATSGADILNAAATGQDLWALEGNDRLNGSAVADSLHGQAGDDTIYGYGGDDVVDGGSGDDLLFGDDDPGSSLTATGADLITNGSFETSGTITGGGGWGIANDSLPGWTKDNAQPFEQVYASGGVSPTDGTFWLDMDSAGGSGSNMSINQTIADLTAGEVVRLQFDHANRTGSDNGGLEVYWNGVLVASYTDYHPGMQGETLDLVAGSGDNVVTFKGTGYEDNTGASLDNVRLHRTVAASAASGDDILTGGAGSDAIDGGGGDDIAIFSGTASEYLVTDNLDGNFSIEDLVANRDGTDLLTSIELLRFSDGDFAPDGLVGGGSSSAFASPPGGGGGTGGLFSGGWATGFWFALSPDQTQSPGLYPWGDAIPNWQATNATFRLVGEVGKWTSQPLFERLDANLWNAESSGGESFAASHAVDTTMPGGVDPWSVNDPWFTPMFTVDFSPAFTADLL